MTIEGPDSEKDARKRIPRSTALWIAVVVGCATAVTSSLIVAAIDRSHRAPLGAWFSDFAKSPGLAGLCALVAASLALWGIQQQVTVTRRGQALERAAAENATWWERFEWTAARAVPASPDDVPLPYDTVISTLTALTKTAKDDVQRTAVGAVTDVAAKTISQNNESDGLTADETQLAAARRQRALQEYSITAGNSPARSAAVEGQIYELDVLEAMRRVVPSARVQIEPRLRDKASNRVMIPDALVEYRGKRIVVEIKNYGKPRRLHSNTVLQVRSLLESSGADAGLIVAPVDVRSEDLSANIIPVVWGSPKDDADLLAALDSVSGQ